MKEKTELSESPAL